MTNALAGSGGEALHGKRIMLLPMISSNAYGARSS
jgi:hypothetical protein